MSVAFAVLTSDPNLLRCELHRLKDAVALGGADAHASAGVGAYAQEEVLLRRFPLESRPVTLSELVPNPPRSEALVFHVGTLPLGHSLEANTQPFRFRRWFFCLTGAVEGFQSVRPELVAGLPDFLRRSIVGQSDAEHAFALFLSMLRDEGRIDDRSLEPQVAAGLLGKTARRLQQLSSANGAARLSSLALIATNQRFMIAVRSGDEPLSYTQLEGSDQCELCGLPSTKLKDEPLVRAHRRRKTLALATQLSPKANGWLDVPPSHALAMDWKQGLSLFAV